MKFAVAILGQQPRVREETSFRPFDGISVTQIILRYRSSYIIIYRMVLALSPKIKIVVIILILFSSTASAYADLDEIWVLIDTESLILKVMQNNKPKEIFRNISIGRNGAALDKRLGDDKTPLGKFRIGWINKSSRYYRFFGFNYPNLPHVRRGLKSKLIDAKTYLALSDALIYKKIPSQNTALGGQIGIHGVGNGNRKLHDSLNWTHGCIALTNHQIDRLARWLTKGTWVVVQ